MREPQVGDSIILYQDLENLALPRIWYRTIVKVSDEEIAYEEKGDGWHLRYISRSAQNALYDGWIHHFLPR